MDYKDTLNLPKTSFEMRAKLPEKERATIQKWEEESLYHRILEKNRGKPKFVLHDGPPYANGNIHHGHVLNKVLKDIIVRYRNMSGFYTAFIPGWDCHGLPIEQQVLKNYEDQGIDHHTVDPAKIRIKCRKHAEKFVKIQRDEFKRMLCTGDWENPYLTMTPKYEATIARELGRWIEKGHLYKGFKPVYWDPVFETALAEAEIEYGEHESPSVYVKFPLVGDLSSVVPKAAGKKAFVVIWTTTPWTLPANLAIAFGPHIEYAAVQVGDEVYIMASDRLPDAAKDIGWQEGDYEIIGTLSADDLVKFKSRHPWIDRDSIHIIADYVTLEQGTGCVHTAPGHGVEDYESGIRYGLDIYAPVDEKGRFTKDVEKYAGMFVFDANPVIVNDMKEMGVLLNPPNQTIKHQYPHSWRSKKPIIFRATEQWFFKIDHNDLRKKALDEIKKTTWIPHWGEARITGMIENRPDWCISRQRVWGVPIPVFRCKDCGEDLVDANIAYHLADLYEEHTTDIWFTWSTKELLPEGTKCKHCGSENLEKTTHIVDVWFDSGVSWAAVCENNEDLGVPTDLYLEGSDQHRGWFHSSLLCSVATRGHAPYKTVLTHGFVVDEKGHKFSKSSRNYVPIDRIINKYGAEIMRMWVVAEDYRNDIRFSNEILNRLVDGYRKIRNTFRFMVGNLYDFSPDEHANAKQHLESIDKWALMKLSEVSARIIKAYENYEFHVIYHTVLDFCTNWLSAFYLDILKDRLYVEAPHSNTRKAAQYVVFEITSALARLLAPILPHTMEEVWENMPTFSNKPESVHLTDFPNPDSFIERDEELLKKWDVLIDVREAVLKELEKSRREKLIGHSLDARVALYAASDSLRSVLAEYGEKNLADLFIVSQVELTNEAAGVDYSEDVFGLHIAVKRALGTKCERCWIYNEEVGSNEKYPDVCPRCASVLEEIGAEGE